MGFVGWFHPVGCLAAFSKVQPFACKIGEMSLGLNK